ncbi:MAG: glycosyltransferase [Deltaproteobacteria bacterium]|nr:glycosyltransferase [Deltaproteobacteria bacterium]
MISVIIPVYHEAARINHLLASLPPRRDMEVLVVDGAPERDTLEALEFPHVHRVASSPGRGTQLNQGAARATGDIFLFLHADTRLPPRALDLIQRALRDPRISGGAFGLRYNSSRPGSSLIACLANIRTAWTRVPYGDQAIFMRAKVFRSLGGFADIPIMEDLELMTRLRRSGHGIQILPSSVLTSPRRHDLEGLARCTARNLALRLLYHLGLSPHRLASIYRPHRD